MLLLPAAVPATNACALAGELPGAGMAGIAGLVGHRACCTYHQ
jgi:hypothetical protein